MRVDLRLRHSAPVRGAIPGWRISHGEVIGRSDCVPEPRPSQTHKGGSNIYRDAIVHDLVVCDPNNRDARKVDLRSRGISGRNGESTEQLVSNVGNLINGVPHPRKRCCGTLGCRDHCRSADGGIAIAEAIARIGSEPGCEILGVPAIDGSAHGRDHLVATCAVRGYRTGNGHSGFFSATVRTCP
jgi:hypothetical protein